MSLEISIEALVEKYAVLLFDAYGVLVNGSGPLPGAAALTKRLADMGKPYYLLTNDSSRLPETAAKRYQGFGLTLKSDQILSSGSLLKRYFEDNSLGGSNCAVLGTPDSESYVQQAGGKIVGPNDQFDALVIADDDFSPFLKTLEVAFSSVCRAVDKDQCPTLLLPNPDLIYPKGGGDFGFAAGSIAAILERALIARYGASNSPTFVRLGKPHSGLFDEAKRRSETLNMVMFGDQIETDIAGANAAGLDSVLMGTGVGSLDSTGQGTGPRPTYVLTNLS
ncbi:MAG: HAD hydrolase-like protein [Chromatiales bacterium]|nr:HAD hydrolase-like protein [Chromatiales bacterium]